MREVDRKKKDFDDYYKSKDTYDKDLGEYDKEIDKETKRKKDIFTDAFEAPTKIREKPAPPTQPTAYDGPTLDLSKALTEGTKTAVDFSDANKDKVGKSAYLVSTISGKENKPSPEFATRMGYMLTSLDSSKTGKVEYVGHVFGKLGQAFATDP